MRTLSTADRTQLELIEQAVFANPFSPERRRLDEALAGRRESPGQDALPGALHRVREVLSRVERDHEPGLLSLRERDRELLAHAHLFDIFHAFSDRLDALIREQIAAGDEPVPVPFAGELFEALAARGFGAEESNRFIAMFFQLRRAFYFINSTLPGHSPCMQAFRLALWNNVFTHDTRLYTRHLWNRMEDFSTLLLGATGTGKGTAAAAIGRSGFIPFDDRRRRFTESFMRSFVAINLSQYPEALIESELFGHRKGAFTGAMESHDGIFQRCSAHGAIFLDEVGEVAPHIQIKLLHVLQERAFSPVGSHARRRFEGRVIAATNRSMSELHTGGRFRPDFFYRLCSDVIHVPSLRQRLDECPAELDDLVTVTVRRTIGKDAPELAALVIERIHAGVGDNYAWPGNVRELEQGVRRILLTRSCAPLVSAERDPSAFTCDEPTTAAALLARYCAWLYRRNGTFEAVARITGLDRRTARRHVMAGENAEP